MPAAVVNWRDIIESAAQVDTDAQEVIFTKARQYVWDPNGLAWVRQTGSSTGVPTEDVSDRAGRLLGHVIVDTMTPALALDATVNSLLKPASTLAALTSITNPVNAAQSGTWTVQPGNTPNSVAWLESQIASRLDAASLCVTATGTVGAAVTLTIPGVASQFHYLGFIQVVRFATALLVAAATPVLVTTTNLPGNPVLSFPADAAAAGTVSIQEIKPAVPIKSSVVNTATTVVCPATTTTIWRVNAWYYPAV